MEKAIDSVEMDGVIIVSPHCFHVPQITLALEKGLHVMSEKPLATTEEEVLKLMEKSKETGKMVQAAYAGVISDEQAYVKRLKESGELGEVTFVQGRVAQMWWPQWPVRSRRVQVLSPLYPVTHPSRWRPPR